VYGRVCLVYGLISAVYTHSRLRNVGYGGMLYAVCC